MLFPTTIAGSLPKPSWLAEPDKLWPQWRLTGADLVAGKLDATLLSLKLQEDAGIDIVTDGEQSRQHFVHGFLEFVDGIDFANKVEMGIRNDRYKAMVPTVTGPLKLRGRVHGTEAKFCRAHTARKLKITMPGPMTIIDTIADKHYGDRVKMAFAFADLLNQEAHALEADGVAGGGAGGAGNSSTRSSSRRRIHPIFCSKVRTVRGGVGGATGAEAQPVSRVTPTRAQTLTKAGCRIMRS